MSTPSSLTPSEFPYATHLNVLFNPLEKIALDPLVAAVRDAWYNQTLVRVNESIVRVGVIQGEYHWHEHTNDDEFFFVLEGRFLIDLELQSDGVRQVSGHARSAKVCGQGGSPSHSSAGALGHSHGRNRWHHSDGQLIVVG
jgi:hypothetical protein